MIETPSRFLSTMARFIIQTIQVGVGGTKPWRCSANGSVPHRAARHTSALCRRSNGPIQQYISASKRGERLHAWHTTGPSRFCHPLSRGTNHFLLKGGPMHPPQYIGSLLSISCSPRKSKLPYLRARCPHSRHFYTLLRSI